MNGGPEACVNKQTTPDEIEILTLILIETDVNLENFKFRTFNNFGTNNLAKHYKILGKF